MTRATQSFDLFALIEMATAIPEIGEVYNTKLSLFFLRFQLDLSKSVDNGKAEFLQ
jgi:hypothetical protein